MDAADKARERRLLNLYGLTIADYDALLAFQGGTCAICDRPPGKVRLAVDHDHLTRWTRGLLCYQCNNKRVGRERKPELFDRIAGYLRTPPAGAVFDEPRVAPVQKPRRRKRRTSSATMATETRTRRRAQ